MIFRSFPVNCTLSCGLCRRMLTRPDGSYPIYCYDTAHRLDRITNSVGEYVELTRDNAASVTVVRHRKADTIVRYAHYFKYDELDRLLRDKLAYNATRKLSMAPALVWL